MLPGPTELVLILVVIVIIFGAGKLGGVGKAVGKSVREFKEEVQVDDKKKEEKPNKEEPSETLAEEDK